MAMLYWLHRPDELNMFDSGYVGVTENLPARMRCHKHRFKEIWDQLKLTILVIGSVKYLFELEKKLRPQKNIGLNLARGGYKNNEMIGEENPNWGKKGQLAPHFQGWYITPLGKFESPNEAAKVHGVNKSTIHRRCRGRNVKGVKLQPFAGYAFERKGWVKS
jgi:hypothetical protein